MRSKYDYYPTPAWCYENLPIDWSQFKTAMEPCEGDGRITKFLQSKGMEVTTCEIQHGKDFFEYGHDFTEDHGFDLIFTNPPFSSAQEFIEHSMMLSTTVIMLQRLDFLATQKRYNFWQQFPPDGVFILSRRPVFVGTKSDSREYCWFVWSDIKELQGFHWIK